MVITDYKGNVVQFKGTTAEALNKGYNVNCVKCSNCSNCSDCYNCSNCSDCSNCSNCSNCSDCSDCSDFSNCYNCSENPLAVIQTNRWIILIRTDKTIKIGCQDHTIDDWMSFTDSQIDEMSNHALTFWQKWKPIILAIVKD